MEYVEVHYKCLQCGATDIDKVPKDQIPAPMVNCWSCHAGQGKDVPASMDKGLGMRLQEGPPSKGPRLASARAN